MHFLKSGVIVETSLSLLSILNTRLIRKSFYIGAHFLTTQAGLVCNEGHVKTVNWNQMGGEVASSRHLNSRFGLYKARVDLHVTSRWNMAFGRRVDLHFGGVRLQCMQHKCLSWMYHVAINCIRTEGQPGWDIAFAEEASKLLWVLFKTSVSQQIAKSTPSYLPFMTVQIINTHKHRSGNDCRTHIHRILLYTNHIILYIDHLIRIMILIGVDQSGDWNTGFLLALRLWSVEVS